MFSMNHSGVPTHLVNTFRKGDSAMAGWQSIHGALWAWPTLRATLGHFVDLRGGTELTYLETTEKCSFNDNQPTNQQTNQPTNQPNNQPTNKQTNKQTNNIFCWGIALKIWWRYVMYVCVFVGVDRFVETDVQTDSMMFHVGNLYLHFPLNVAILFTLCR